MDAFKDALEKKKKDAMKIEIIINGEPHESKEAKATTSRAPEVQDKTTEAEGLEEILGDDEKQGREPVSLGERAKVGMRARLKNLKK